nr:hypothetical protein CPGR_00225 [Mycolicibacter nonchromogenicus]
MPVETRCAPSKGRKSKARPNTAIAFAATAGSRPSSARTIPLGLPVVPDEYRMESPCVRLAGAVAG